MAVAAVPAYLGQDFSDAAPGHKFYLYFRVWDRATWSVPDSAEADAARQAGTLSDDDRRRMHALAERQAALAQSLLDQPRRGLWQLPARSTAPFATGLGMEHPLENGFAFLSPYGLPYLPGSGIKGVVRQAARELTEGEFGEPNADGWSEPAIDTLFGKPAADDEDTRRGALAFWDAYPVPDKDKQALQVEIMTPHQTHYYTGGQSPHDSGSPNPIRFLAMPPGIRFSFYVECNRPLLEHLDASLAAAQRWQALLDAAFRHAFDWLGFGAKTAVGYGAMAVDEWALGQAEQEAAEKQQAATRKAELEAMDPFPRRLEELLDQRDDKSQPDYVHLIQQLEAGAFEGEDKRRAAKDIRARMEKQGKWNPDGKGSKPAQRKAHKHTLTVRGYLGE
ncbi:type III-B CRISPR module RAMP protein Cmr6 [Nitrococcus mobilis]|uniref:CRISPR type III-associated protein domain-containing protein n=1 Tax=Nitrococcus mobilis Nb-231 TaxID=314278 RepID=A4BL62_9GAMM|nr:type III-B CRISPR module RAMP protein Cmr6 [Nitrococcus mobilis]EAR23050.1 hypothetical protein NB231_14558 [Nitrococcus mobilis Nb-231]